MSKNRKSANTRSYHHGNLYEALVAVGLETLRQKNANDISLREVARNVGVSVTSVYRHFSNKQAFIEALCVEGSQMLATVVRGAMDSTGGGAEGFDASGLAYVRFALENPTLFRLMCRASSSEPIFSDPENPAMKELLFNVASLLPEKTPARQQQIRALHAWAIVHGIAMLVLEGQLPADDELILAVIRTPSA